MILHILNFVYEIENVVTRRITVQSKSIFITQSYLWTTTTCQQRPQILGPKSGRYTRVWLYSNLKFYTLAHLKRKKQQWNNISKNKHISLKSKRCLFPVSSLSSLKVFYLTVFQPRGKHCGSHKLSFFYGNV